MSLRSMAYKAGQIIGAAGGIFIGSWLVLKPWFETNELLRWIEVFMAFFSAMMLIADACDVNPTED